MSEAVTGARPPHRPTTGQRGARRLTLLTIGALLVGLFAGCGVPDSGPPVVVSSAPVPGSQGDPDSQRQQIVAPDPMTATNPSDLVRLYFTASGVDDNPEELQKNVSAFFTVAGRRTWRPDPAGRTVVRVSGYTITEQKTQTDDTPAKATVRVRGQLVGTLGDRGAVQPLPLSRSRTYQRDFHLEHTSVSGGTEWLIADPPAETLLSAEAMNTLFDPTIVYFASPDHQALVPDLRYVPKNMVPQKQRTVLVDWLLAGPSTWLGQAAVSDIPEGTKRRGNVVRENNNVVVVDLSGDAASPPHEQMMAAQLAWTLRLLVPRLQVRVEGRPIQLPGVRGTVFDAATWRVYNTSTIGAGSSGYYVSGGRIVPARTGASLPAVLSGTAATELNTHVQQAGLSVSAATVALVRTGSGGRPTIWLGRVAAQNHNGASYTSITGLGSPETIGQPSMLPNSPTAVVPVDGALRAVTSSGASYRVSLLEQPPSGRITAVSVAPDGCRVAFVADHHLYVAPLLTGQGPEHLSIGRLRPLATTFTDITDVTWAQEDEIAFGGRGSVAEDGPLSDGPRGGAWQFSLDDVSSDLLTGASGDTVPTQIASATSDPAKGGAHGSILLSARGKILQVTGNEVAPPGDATEPPRGTAPFFPS